MQLLPQLFFEWKKAVSTHTVVILLLKKGVKITFERFYTKVVFRAIMVQWVSKDFSEPKNTYPDL